MKQFRVFGLMLINFLFLIVYGCGSDSQTGTTNQEQPITTTTTIPTPIEDPEKTGTVVTEPSQPVAPEPEPDVYETTPDVIEGTIDGEFNGFDSDKIFKLTNGQVWQQDEYKYSYSYKYRPSVTIVKSGIYYKMLVDGMSDAIKVKLIAGSLGKSRKSSTGYTSDVIEAYITSDFRGFSHGNIFKLDNGQVWEQSEYYTYTYTYTRPKVMIYRTGGEYKLKFDNIDRAVTVRKIN